jgi:hypothetical protein
MFTWNIMWISMDYTVLYSQRQNSL